MVIRFSYNLVIILIRFDYYYYVLNDELSE